MARGYTLKKRAEGQAQTRRRIVEAAVELHGTVGPARTTLSMVADRAGVQRQTLYAHFPDERQLYMACSGLALERDPLPDADKWRALPTPAERLRRGLADLYGWFERNAQLAGCVLRDAEHHALTRDIAALRFDPPLEAMHRTLSEGLDSDRLPLLGLALSYFTWRTLALEHGLSADAAAQTMACAILGRC